MEDMDCWAQSGLLGPQSHSRYGGNAAGLRPPATGPVSGAVRHAKGSADAGPPWAIE